MSNSGIWIFGWNHKWFCPNNLISLHRAKNVGSFLLATLKHFKVRSINLAILESFQHLHLIFRLILHNFFVFLVYRPQDFRNMALVNERCDFICCLDGFDLVELFA